MALSPSAVGSLETTPLSLLLVEALEKRLSGTVELRASDAAPEFATIVFWRGRVAKIRSSTPCYLSSVVYELGFISSAELDASLLQLAKGQRLYGELLLERGALSREDLSGALHEQTLRKLTQLFTLRRSTQFAVYDQLDLLPNYGGRDTVLVDTYAAIWRGIRDFPSEPHVQAILQRAGDARFRVSADADVDRFRFQREETAIVQSLRAKPMNVSELRALGVLPALTLDLLLCCLLITRQVELVEQERGMTRAVSGTRPVTRASSATALPAQSLSPRAADIRERARVIHGQHYYQRLGVAFDATAAQINVQFASLASTWDPATLPPELDSVRQDCARVFLAMAEAFETLLDPQKRELYTRRLALRGANRQSAAGHDIHEPALDLAASGAATPLEGAHRCLRRGEPERAERLARAAYAANPNDAAALALLTWLEAQRPTQQSVQAARALIAVLDGAVAMDAGCADAFYYRALLHARTENHRAAFRDLQTVVALDPNHGDAVRMLRVYHMRIRNGSVSMKAVSGTELSAQAAPAPAETRSSGVMPRVSSESGGRGAHGGRIEPPSETSAAKTPVAGAPSAADLLARLRRGRG